LLIVLSTFFFAESVMRETTVHACKRGHSDSRSAGPR
jgi:hypothetical protein